MTRAIPAILTIAIVVLLVAVVVVARSPASVPATEQSELGGITNTIRSAFLTRGQACMAEHYDEQLQYDAALRDFWSPITPAPNEVATMTIRWAKEYPTLPPMVQAEVVATANAEYSAGTIDEKTYLYSIDASEPTPDWNPNYSPRDWASRMLRICYEQPGYVDFGVASVYEPNITITGNTAEGTVRIAWWAKISDASNTVYDRQHDERYHYIFERNSTGVWKIVDEFQETGGQGS